MIAIEEEEKKPKTQPQVDRGGSGKPPRPTAVGMADGGDDDDNYVRGQIVQCKIGNFTPKGYDAVIEGSEVRAILVSDEHWNVGDIATAIFSHWSDSGLAILESPDEVAWKEAYKYEPSLEHPNSLRRPQPKFNIKTPFAKLFARSVGNQFEFFGAVEMPNAYKRALDMFPPPLTDSKTKEHNVTSTNYLKNKLKKLRKEEFTGCIKAESNSFYSRGAMLMFKGKCMGAIYSNNFEQKTDETTSAMRTLLMELYSPGSSFETYSLPEDIVRPFAALFTGKEVSTQPSKSEFANYIDTLEKFLASLLTGVITIETASNSMIFVFIYDGNATGYFDVQTRIFANDTRGLEELIENSQIRRIDAFILAEEELKQTEFDPIEYIPDKLFH